MLHLSVILSLLLMATGGGILTTLFHLCSPLASLQKKKKSTLLSALFICCFTHMFRTLPYTSSKLLSLPPYRPYILWSLSHHPLCLFTVPRALPHPSCSLTRSPSHPPCSLHPPPFSFPSFIFPSLLSRPFLFASPRAFSTSSECHTS